ncbi:hypothetical protein TIFTF001_023397 [Ficus carica]|uniref:Transmembrane protein n=1 Tax=Ficus carica TaxID=3494 RepID=A0AA88DF99_FICCA|nr:hypothetical protein TIFTF001_023397 [Ficus carica]
MHTTRVGLRGGGEGVGSVRRPVLPIVGGMCPSLAAYFSFLLMAFFPRWSDHADGCSGIDGCGFARGFCIDRVLVVVWMGVVWWAELEFASPVVGVFLRVWDRGLFRLSLSGLIICVLSRWFVNFRSIWWFPNRSVAGRLAYSGFCFVGLFLCWCMSLTL